MISPPGAYHNDKCVMINPPGAYHNGGVNENLTPDLCSGFDILSGVVLKTVCFL